MSEDGLKAKNEWGQDKLSLTQAVRKTAEIIRGYLSAGRGEVRLVYRHNDDSSTSDYIHEIFGIELETHVDIDVRDVLELSVKSLGYRVTQFVDAPSRSDALQAGPMAIANNAATLGYRVVLSPVYPGMWRIASPTGSRLPYANYFNYPTKALAQCEVDRLNGVTTSEGANGCNSLAGQAESVATSKDINAGLDPSSAYYRPLAPARPRTTGDAQPDARRLRRVWLTRDEADAVFCRSLRQALGFPGDVQWLGSVWHEDRSAYCVTLRSSTFEPVPIGEVIPVLQLETHTG